MAVVVSVVSVVNVLAVMSVVVVRKVTDALGRALVVRHAAKE